MTVPPEAPVITSASVANGADGAAFSYTITATNNPTSFSASDLPAGLTLDMTTGVISGTPSAAGTFTVTLGASNASIGGSDSDPFYLTLTVASASATVTLGNLNATYDGSPHAASVTTVPADLAVDVTVTYNGSATVPTNAGSYAVVATVNDPNNNYTGSADGTLVIVAGVASVTLGNLSATYDGSPHAASVTTSPAVSSVTVTYNGLPTAPTSAGTYSVVATVIDPNYTGTAGAPLVIAKATPTLTWATPAAIDYGAALSAAQLDASASVPGTFAYSPAVGTTLGAGTQTLSATFTPTDTTDYTTATATEALTVNPKATTFTVAPTSFTYTGAAQGPTVTPSLAGATFTTSGTPTATSPGSYTVTATANGNYSGTSGAVSWSIAKATPVITWATPAAITSGTALSGTQLNATASVAGTFVYSPVAGTVPAVGTQTLSVTFTPTDGTNYTTVTATVSLTVTQATTTTFTVAPTSFIYTGAAQGPTITAAPAGATFTISGMPTGINAGNYTVTATASGGYTGTSGPVPWSIAKARPILTWATPVPIAKGTPLSATQLDASANIPGAFAYSPGAGTVLAVGTQILSVTFTPADTANYTMATATVSLTVKGTTAATITLTDLEQIYDGTPKAVTATTDPAGLAVDITYNGVPTPPKNPGSYVVYATFHDPAYTGSATDTLDITITALIRHAPTLNGDIDGSAQILLPENITLNSAMISGDLLVPGTPAVRLNGHPTYGSTLDGSGNAAPSNYTVTLNGNAILRHVVRRTDPIAMPAVSLPPSPAGRNDVTLNNSNQRVADYTKLRNLTLNGNAGLVAVPPGTYGTFIANGNSGFVVGVAGATDAAVYNLQGLTLNGNAQMQIAGPIILTVASDVTVNGNFGVKAHPEWLMLQVAQGGLTLNGDVAFYGYVTAPNGPVIINGDSTLHGEVAADRLTINGDGLLTEVLPEGNCHDGPCRGNPGNSGNCLQR